MLRKLVFPLLRWTGYGLVCLSLVVGLYLASAQWIGARWEGPSRALAQQPVSNSGIQSPSAKRRIYLVTGFLHADFAIPVDDGVRARFPFLSATSVPMDHPNLKHILVGWGSEAFYTTAGTYWDIRPSTVVQAVTGDSAVMRFTAAGPLAPSDDVIPIDVSQAQFDQLLAAITGAMPQTRSTPTHLANASIGPYDAFFEAKGDFNIFYPCNQWVNETLRGIGFRLGRWTPTTGALKASLVHFKHIAP